LGLYFGNYTKCCNALDCHQSQFYEWLAWDKGVEDEVAVIGDRMLGMTM